MDFIKKLFMQKSSHSKMKIIDDTRIIFFQPALIQPRTHTHTHTGRDDIITTEGNVERRYDDVTLKN